MNSSKRPIKSRRRKSFKAGSKNNLLGRTIEFEINTMDSLGQGVAKVDGKPCFIPKTLPGEKGQASITKASKGVLFARIDTLDITANNREEAPCPHFNQCPGCHYLHTDYQSELEYKRQALQHHLGRLEEPAPEILINGAEQRLGYRNRIQLHYRHKYLGMIDGSTDQVLEIPSCQVIDDQLKDTFDSLFDDRSWSDDRQLEDQRQGHCELYLTDQGVDVQWNKPYAHGGFSQVNTAMNQVLKAAVSEVVGTDCGSLLDLFAGDGNLSELLVQKTPSMNRVMVDYAPDRVGHEELDFIHLDLFSESALRTFKARSEFTAFDVLLVDPPRKGFPELAQWVKAFKPKKLIYVSCNAATMVRDLQQLSSKHRIEQVRLIDLFPGTYHYETLVSVSL